MRTADSTRRFFSSGISGVVHRTSAARAGTTVPVDEGLTIQLRSAG